MTGKNATAWKLTWLNGEEWWKISALMPENCRAYIRWLDWSDATAQQPGTSMSAVLIQRYCQSSPNMQMVTVAWGNKKHKSLFSTSSGEVTQSLTNLYFFIGYKMLEISDDISTWNSAQIGSEYWNLHSWKKHKSWEFLLNDCLQRLINYSVMIMLAPKFDVTCI